MWSTQVFVLDDDGGEVITVTTAGEKPNVKVGQSVNELHAGRCQSLAQAARPHWSDQVGIGRQGCCTFRLYRPWKLTHGVSWVAASPFWVTMNQVEVVALHPEPRAVATLSGCP